MRPIDADILKEQWETQDAKCGEYTAYHFLASINDAPTIEAEPVRHGKWDTFFSDSYKVHEIGVECSCCGYRTQERTTYCPNCGARMEVDDETN